MKHKYVKTYDKKEKHYVNRCAVCGKTVSYPAHGKDSMWSLIKCKILSIF